ncbi:hypothetical protein A5885_001083, partial [Enterococcus sp. 8E11_MSG4843]
FFCFWIRTKYGDAASNTCFFFFTCDNYFSPIYCLLFL